jgi:hypothetical protein
MTTTKELRQALQAVEPLVRSVDVDAVRLRARRVRRDRRILGAALGCAVIATVATGVPNLAPHLPMQAADVSLPGVKAPRALSHQDGAGIGVVAEAAMRTKLTLRKGPLSKVRFEGQHVDIGVGGFKIWLAPATTGTAGGQFCHGKSGNAASCLAMARQDSGFLGTVGLSGPRDGITKLMVLEAPVERAIAVSAGKQVPTTIIDLGQRYVGVVALMAPQPADPAKIDERIWVFDDRDRLVARSEFGQPVRAKARTVADAQKATELVPRNASLPESTADGPEVLIVDGATASLQQSTGMALEVTWGSTASSITLERWADGWLYSGDGQVQEPKGKALWVGVLAGPVTEVVAADEKGRQVQVTTRDLGQGFVLAFAVTPDARPVRSAWAFGPFGELIARRPR